MVDRKDLLYSTFCIDFGITRWFISLYIFWGQKPEILIMSHERRALTNDKFSSGRKSPKSLEE